jgi:CRP/FNR family transcriptional regulator
LNANEGRDPTMVSDSLECGTAATYLGIDVEALANALSELGRLGLIEPSPARGLRLLDLDALRRLANKA